MILFRLLIAGLLVVAVRAEAGCYRPVDGAIIAQEGTAFGAKNGISYVSTVTRPPAPQTLPRASLVIYDGQCRLLHQESFDEAAGILLEPVALGSTELLQATVKFPGGSGASFLHLLFNRQKWDGVVAALAPTALEHTNMGGFHVGELGGGRGPGIAIWDAQWDDGAHYDPHPYGLTLYRWDGKAFVGPEVLKTPGKLNPNLPDAVPAAFGLPFKNDTQPERFENLMSVSGPIGAKTPTPAQ